MKKEEKHKEIAGAIKRHLSKYRIIFFEKSLLKYCLALVLKSNAAVVLFLLLLSPFAFADEWTSSLASHQTLYADTITSKTGGSPVRIADSQGLFVTESVGIGTASLAEKLTLGANSGGANPRIQINDDAGNMNFRVGDSGSQNTAFFEMYDASVLKVNICTRTSQCGDTFFNGGNVGIGTASPGTALDIASGNVRIRHSTAGSVGITISNTNPTPPDPNTGGQAVLEFSAGGASGGDTLFKFDPNGAGVNADMWAMGIDNSDLDKFKITTGADLFDIGAKLTIDRSGNVGIGTTSPATTLHVNGALRLDASASTLIFGDATPELLVGSDALLIGNNAGSTEIMRITNTGNVGIGTTTPSAMLHASKTGEAVVRISANGANIAKLTFDSQGNTGWIEAQRIGSPANDLHIKFFTEGPGGITEKMRIRGDGNVGIGDTTPDTKLDVIGDISIGQSDGQQCVLMARFTSCPAGSTSIGSDSGWNICLDC